MEKYFSSLLIRLANYMDQNFTPRTIRFTDSIVGMRHKVTTSEIANGLRKVAIVGNTVTPETEPIFNLLAARADGDVKLPDEIHDVLDAASEYMVLHGGGGDYETIAEFEEAVRRCFPPDADIFEP